MPRTKGRFVLIRKANLDDLPRILEIYAYARQFMRNTGNPTQWKEGTPVESTLRRDIAAGQLYVQEDDGVHAVFALILGDDPTYAEIDGAWLSDAPYATLHRVAGDGTRHGVLNQAVAFAKTQCGHLRIDTHKDNQIMQRAIAKNGFRYCGVIITDDGTPRLAYEWL